MTHAIPLGSQLLLTLPEELLDGDTFAPFCPGITGTVECWVISHDPLDPDPAYTICPHKAHKLCGQPMWDFLAEIDAIFAARTAPAGMHHDQWFRWTMTDLAMHRIERGVPERLLLPFVRKD